MNQSSDDVDAGTATSALLKPDKASHASAGAMRTARAIPIIQHGARRTGPGDRLVAVALIGSGEAVTIALEECDRAAAEDRPSGKRSPPPCTDRGSLRLAAASGAGGEADNHPRWGASRHPRPSHSSPVVDGAVGEPVVREVGTLIRIPAGRRKMEFDTEAGLVSGVQ